MRVRPKAMPRVHRHNDPWRDRKFASFTLDCPTCTTKSIGYLAKQCDTWSPPGRSRLHLLVSLEVFHCSTAELLRFY